MAPARAAVRARAWRGRAEQGWLRAALRDTPEMINDRREGTEGGAQAGRSRRARSAGRGQATVPGGPPARAPARTVGWRAAKASRAHQGAPEGADGISLVTAIRAAGLSDADRSYPPAVRDEVLRMKRDAHASGTANGPSQYWAEELDQIDYLIDASPLIVRKLRHHAFHITGIRPYDYRERGRTEGASSSGGCKRCAMLAGAPTCCVAEHDALWRLRLQHRRPALQRRHAEVLRSARWHAARAGVLETFRRDGPAPDGAGDRRGLGRLRLSVQDVVSRRRPT